MLMTAGHVWHRFRCHFAADLHHNLLHSHHSRHNRHSRHTHHRNLTGPLRAPARGLKGPHFGRSLGTSFHWNDVSQQPPPQLMPLQPPRDVTRWCPGGSAPIAAPVAASWPTAPRMWVACYRRLKQEILRAMQWWNWQNHGAAKSCHNAPRCHRHPKGWSWWSQNQFNVFFARAATSASHLAFGRQWSTPHLHAAGSGASAGNLGTLGMTTLPWQGLLGDLFFPGIHGWEHFSWFLTQNLQANHICGRVTL